MSPRILPRATRLAAVLLAGSMLAGCGIGARLTQVGDTPPLTTIQDPQRQPGYKPVSLPMPAPQIGEKRPNSLWQAGSRAFFKDQRASQIGDILTVLISLDDNAKFDNNLTRQRESADSQGISSLFGLQGQIAKILPKGTVPSTLVDTNGSTSTTTTGQIDRKEKINLKVATLVTQVLPNGNLVVQGHQEMRVNYEVRELQLTGVIRPQDIGSTNTISYEKIAEARVSYGGRGQMMDVAQPGYGTQILNLISPF